MVTQLAKGVWIQKRARTHTKRQPARTHIKGQPTQVRRRPTQVKGKEPMQVERSGKREEEEEKQKKKKPRTHSTVS